MRVRILLVVALVLAWLPVGGNAGPAQRRFGGAATALASGWMRIRGTRRRRAVDRGFVLSDHADWPGLLEVIAATGAATVWTSHGYAPVLARWLQERGTEARVLPARPLESQDADEEGVTSARIDEALPARQDEDTPEPATADALEAEADL